MDQDHTSRTTRRGFLGRSLGAGLGIATASAATPVPLVRTPPDPGRAPRELKIVILGGTAFLGPAIVEAAQARGHSLTLFNRGRTNPGLFPDVEKLRGDRDTGDLDALKGRTFDAVVDTSGYVPAHVSATARLLAEQARHYTFISTISVYPEFGEVQKDIDEDSQLATVGEDVVAQVTTIRQSLAHYGAMKVLCEQAAEAAMPGRVANIRPGLIVGPRDGTDRFTWWPVRVHKGGEVLAPGDLDAKIQPIDVRDLASWVVHCIENGVVGAYNACGFEGTLTMAEFLYGCKCATSTPCSFVWASEEFLRDNKVGAWMEMPMWIPREGRSYARNERAIAQGLTFRPVADTIRDTLAWALTERGDRPFERTGVRKEREAKLIAAWRASDEGK